MLLTYNFLTAFFDFRKAGLFSDVLKGTVILRSCVYATCYFIEAPFSHFFQDIPQMIQWYREGHFPLDQFVQYFDVGASMYLLEDILT